MKLKVGKLYSYPTSRNIFSTVSHEGNSIGFIETDEPFVFLGIIHLNWVDSYKILNAKGIVGYIYVGYPENLKELSHD